MKKIPMPWTDNPPAKEKLPDVPASSSRALGYLEAFLDLLKKNWSLVILILSVASLFAYRGHLGASEGSGSNLLVGLASKTAIFKGDFVEPLAMEEVNIPRSSLTKNQAWSLLQFNLEQLGSDLRLRAKRDIPPRKPLQWTDIEVLREGYTREQSPLKPVEIRYSKFETSPHSDPETQP
jgi:hypothetical protein